MKLQLVGLRRTICGCLGIGLSASSLAALSERGVILEVQSEQKQGSTVTAKSSDGARDKKQTNVRVLNISYRSLGMNAGVEHATLQWVFIGKEPVNGSLVVYSHGETDVTVTNRSASFPAESSELTRKTKNENNGMIRTRTTQGIVPHGWAVRIVQSGRVIKASASAQGLLNFFDKTSSP